MNKIALSSRVRHLAVLVFILLAGAALRLVDIGIAPPGLYSDEAINGLDATAVLAEEPQFYFTANNGREPLYIYLITVIQAILGPSPLAVRLPAAFVGILTIAATYAMAKSFWHHRVGAYAAAILTGTFWHVHLSRVGFRAVMLPLFTALMLASAARGVRTSKRIWWILTGLAYGLSWYTYTAVRVTPIALLVIVIMAWLWQRDQAKRHWKHVLLACCIALIIILPLGIYTLVHPDIVLGRAGQISIFNDKYSGTNPIWTLIQQIALALGMFFIRGDWMWRHNLSLRPVWDPVMGVMFVIGTGVLIHKVRKDVGVMVALVWICVMLVPTIIAANCPHFLRVVGILPVIAVIPAIGLTKAEEWLTSLNTKLSSYLSIIPWLCIVFTMGSTLIAYQTYINTRITYHWFSGGQASLASDINEFSGMGWNQDHFIQGARYTSTVYMDPQLWEHYPTVRYLSAGNVIPHFPVEPLDSQSESEVVFWPTSDWESTIMPMAPHPAYIDVFTGPDIQGEYEATPYPVAIVLRTRPTFKPTSRIVQFNNGMMLHELNTDSDGSSSEVSLTWSTEQSLTASYIVVVHALVDETPVAQHEGVPGLGFLATTMWQPGDVVLDRHGLEMDIPQNTDALRIAVYNSDTGEYVPLSTEPTSHWFTWPVSEELDD